MKKLILLSIILSGFMYSLACDCIEIKKENLVNYGLENSEFVFIGNVINVNPENQTFIFQIYEVFKGEYSSDTIYGQTISNCAIYPDEKGLWIVFANMLNDSTIELGNCIPSLSLNNPLIITPPPLEGEDPEISQLKHKIDKLGK